jgi:hypothetical protein
MIIANVVILVLNIIIYIKNRKTVIDKKIYSLPIFEGNGVIILNKKDQKVVEFKEPLK